MLSYYSRHHQSAFFLCLLLIPAISSAEWLMGGTGESFQDFIQRHSVENLVFYQDTHAGDVNDRLTQLASCYSNPSVLDLDYSAFSGHHAQWITLPYYLSMDVPKILLLSPDGNRYLFSQGRMPVVNSSPLRWINHANLGSDPSFRYTDLLTLDLILPFLAEIQENLVINGIYPNSVESGSPFRFNGRNEVGVLKAELSRAAGSINPAGIFDFIRLFNRRYPNEQIRLLTETEWNKVVLNEQVSGRQFELMQDNQGQLMAKYRNGESHSLNDSPAQRFEYLHFRVTRKTLTNTANTLCRD